MREKWFGIKDVPTFPFGRRMLTRTQDAFARQWGLHKDFFQDFDPITGKKNEHKEFFAFTLGRTSSNFEGDKLLDAVSIRSKRRFGTAIISLIHAVLVAEALGVEKIFAPRYEIVPRRIDGVLVTASPETGINVLHGDFFSGRLIQPFLGDIDMGVARSRLAPALVELFGINLELLQPLGDKDLVIHLRSGDIFHKKEPNPNYGQPPLAFYQEVVTSQTWEKIWLVFENGLNPVVPALVSWLSKEKMNFEISCSDWKSDITLCFRAKQLVGGRGTFLQPVLWGSKHLQAIYTFENLKLSDGLRSEISFHNFLDKSGDYVSSIFERWENSPSQREMMLHYSGANIALD